LRQLRVIRDQDKYPRAALLWAYVSDEVHEALQERGGVLRPHEWNSGPHLWLLDVLAPFGHGLQIARYIARNPPPHTFWYIRSSEDGRVRKVVECDVTRGRRGFLRALQPLEVS
jgi:cytolysin-activating lysine-acyltransferase